MRRGIQIDGVFDIETSRWTKFLCGGLLTKDGAYIERRYDRESDFVDRLLHAKGTLWAHAGGHFDFTWFIGHLVKRGVRLRVSLAGTRVVFAHVGEVLTLCDSMALVPVSLEKFTQGMGIEKAPYPLPCQTASICGPKCKGFCRFRCDMPAEDWQKVLRYLEADCRSLYQALTHLEEWCAGEDIDLGATVGSSAYRHATRFLGLPKAALPTATHNFVRRAYYGGRVFVGRPMAAAGEEADVVSMYPHALSIMRAPVGTPSKGFGSSAGVAYAAGLPGAYEARVRVPQSYIPPLPYRGRDRNAYPYGTLEGVWMQGELAHAEKVGCVVDRIRRGVWWKESVPGLFAPWVEKMFALRQKAGKSGPVGTFLKFYLNSVPGKMGQRGDFRSYYTAETAKWRRCRECGGRGFRRSGPCEGCAGRGQFPDAPIGPFYEQVGYRLDACAHVEWAAMVTAAGRVKWHGFADTGSDDAVYGDTDSVLSLSKRPGLGSNLGDFEDKGAFFDFDAMSPKFYRLRRGENVLYKSKGIHATDDAQLKALFEQGEGVFRWETVRGLSGGARASGRNGSPLFQRLDISRRIRHSFGDRILEPGASMTRAQSVEAFT